MTLPIIPHKLSFDNLILYVKPLYIDCTNIQQISQMCCCICLKFTSDMMKFKCCNKFVCQYCKDGAHLCIKIKKLIPLSKEEGNLIRKTDFSCCFYLSGCKKQITYDEIASHVKACNYRYYIPDDKIDPTPCNKYLIGKDVKDVEKYLCIFCSKPPRNLFLTSCCYRTICSYCGYSNKLNKFCLCSGGSEKSDKKDKPKTLIIVNPIDINIEEYLKQPIFKCSYANCNYIGTQNQINKHAFECVEGYCERKYGMTEPNPYYNFEFSALKEITIPNYLEEDIQNNDKKYPKNISVRSILKLSDSLIAIGTGSGEIDCWEENTNIRAWSTKEHTSFIYSMINIEVNHFVSAELSEVGLAIIWGYDNQSSTVKRKVELLNKGVWVLCYIDSDIIACGMDNNSILIWDVYNKYLFKGSDDGKKKKKFEESSDVLNIKNKINIHSAYVKSLIYIQSKDLLLSGGADSRILTTRVSSSGFSSTESFNKEHKGVILSFCCLDENYIASSDDLGVIKVWTFEQKASVKTLLIHTNAVTQLIFYEPKILISSSLDKTIKYTSFDEKLNFSVIKNIITKDPIWAMITLNTYTSFTVISYNSSLITTYSTS